MQGSKEQQGEIRQPSSVISAKKQRKTTEWKDQRSLQENQRYQGDMSCKDGLDKGQKWYGPNKQKILRRGSKKQDYTEDASKKKKKSS